jgi:hypothetical protein
MLNFFQNLARRLALITDLHFVWFSPTEKRLFSEANITKWDENLLEADLTGTILDMSVLKIIRSICEDK